MKNILFLSIIIILFKTGNVLSNNNLFNVNNIEIGKETSKNKEKKVNLAFRNAFDQLTNRLLLEEDYQRVSNTSIADIKKLISYYQIKDTFKKEEDKNIKTANIFFDKERMHKFFYSKNLLYSDIINTEVIIFPLLKKEKQYFIYSQNYFYENWKNENLSELIKYILPTENIENIQEINLNKENIYELSVSNCFSEYDSENLIFAFIEIKQNKNAEVYLKTRIEGKKINKNLFYKNKSDLSEKNFNNKIILEINNVIRDLIKSQNLIDVRTPSFLNAEIKMNKKKSNLFEFNTRLKKIDLIDKFYVQEINKDYVSIKIKYLGKISKIIDKFKEQEIDLIMKNGKWQLNII